MANPTIKDIAALAGLSKSTVSSALNDRPGVSAEARRRVAEIVKDIGWTPSSAARALSGAPRDTVGFVLARPPRILGDEAFFMQLIAGIESRLSEEGISLMLQVTADVDAEVRQMRKWSAERRLDGIFVTDLRVVDPRLDVLETLGLPTVAFGLEKPRSMIASLATDEAGSITETVRYLAALGHARIVRMAGRPEFVNTDLRTRAFLKEMAALNLVGEVVELGGYLAMDGEEATRRVLSRSERPTAIIYENETTAVAALGVAAEFGLRVPEDISIVAIGDFPICRVTSPPLTTLGRDVFDFGREGADSMIRLLQTGRPDHKETPPPRIVPRGSTGSARGSSSDRHS